MILLLVQNNELKQNLKIFQNSLIFSKINSQNHSPPPFTLIFNTTTCGSGGTQESLPDDDDDDDDPTKMPPGIMPNSDVYFM